MDQAHPGLVNIRGGDEFRVTKSAHVGKRAQLNNLMNSAYNSSTKKHQQQPNEKRFRAAATHNNRGKGQQEPDEFHIPTSDLGGGRIYEEDIE